MKFENVSYNTYNSCWRLEVVFGITCGLTLYLQATTRLLKLERYLRG